MTPNVAAFLSMIAVSEGTQRAHEPYRVCYGYKHVIEDLSDHPAVTGEWQGESLPDAVCIGAGLSPPCKSTAAGRYQINKPTWLRLKAILHLHSFNGDSQDDACVQLLKEHGALELINAGNVEGAVHRCRNEWASLPGGTSGQPQHSIDVLAQVYRSHGGTLA